jgi:hypothetical protein
MACATYPNYCSNKHDTSFEHRPSCRQWDVDGMPAHQRSVIKSIAGDKTDYSKVVGQRDRKKEPGWINLQEMFGGAPLFTMHVSIVMGGTHPDDEYHETVKFGTLVAKAGHGILRTVVDQGYLPTRKLLSSIKEDKGRPRIHTLIGRGWQAIHLFTFIIFVGTFSIAQVQATPRRVWVGCCWREFVFG